MGFSVLPEFGLSLCSQSLGEFRKFSFTILLNTCNPDSLSTPSGIPIILIIDYLVVSVNSCIDFVEWSDFLPDIFIICVFSFWLSSKSDHLSSAAFILKNRVFQLQNLMSDLLNLCDNVIF